jgi:hypothetical protein
MFVGEMASLGFPIHELRGSDGYGLISQILNGGGHPQADGVQKNIDSLVVMEVERGRLVFNLF